MLSYCCRPGLDIIVRVQMDGLLPSPENCVLNEVEESFSGEEPGVRLIHAAPQTFRRQAARSNLPPSAFYSPSSFTRSGRSFSATWATARNSAHQRSMALAAVLRWVVARVAACWADS